jgi:hypothetical protein
MFMKASDPVDSLLQRPAELLDGVAAQLSKVGIDLAPLWLQLFLLAIVIALLIPVIKAMRARLKKDRLPLVAAVVLGLVGMGVVIGIIENATTPKRVGGSVDFARRADLRLALLDFRDQPISKGSGLVDTATGRFALHYSPFIDGRARKIRISANGCRPIEIPLARAQLRAESERQWSFRCAIT